MHEGFHFVYWASFVQKTNSVSFRNFFLCSRLKWRSSIKNI
jgi:hypothetical protein